MSCQSCGLGLNVKTSCSTLNGKPSSGREHSSWAFRKDVQRCCRTRSPPSSPCGREREAGLTHRPGWGAWTPLWPLPSGSYTDTRGASQSQGRAPFKIRKTRSQVPSLGGWPSKQGCLPYCRVPGTDGGLPTHRERGHDSPRTGTLSTRTAVELPFVKSFNNINTYIFTRTPKENRLPRNVLITCGAAGGF